MLPTLNEQIEHELLCVRGARERGEQEDVDRHQRQLDYLLHRVPRTARF